MSPAQERLNPVLCATISLGAALVAFAMAFQASARTHAADMLLNGAICGNPLQDGRGPDFLGHCAACWTAGSLAGLVVMSAMAVLASAPVLRRVP